MAKFAIKKLGNNFSHDSIDVLTQLIWCRRVKHDFQVILMVRWCFFLFNANDISHMVSRDVIVRLFFFLFASKKKWGIERICHCSYVISKNKWPIWHVNWISGGRIVSLFYINRCYYCCSYFCFFFSPNDWIKVNEMKTIVLMQSESSGIMNRTWKKCLKFECFFLKKKMFIFRETPSIHFYLISLIEQLFVRVFQRKIPWI